jgi:preprotein translocase subunit SecE
VARDRRRAKQRRDRQARAAGGTQARRADAGTAPPPREPAPDAPHDAEHLHEHEAPELASGEVDLAEAQLEIGRPELIEAARSDVPDVVDDDVDLPELADEQQFEGLEDRVDEAEEVFEEGGANGRVDEGAEVVRTRRGAARAPSRAAEPREGNRLVVFLRGSWRELQRVQWPDRRQVGQATAVTIGFVIVAGAFLGVADFLANKIVDFII